MSIGRLTCCALLMCAALAHRVCAQDSTVKFGEQPPLAITGFAVGDAGYDRNLERGTAVAGKIALSLFRPWSDHLYIFGQLTTHLEEADSGPPETHIEIDNNSGKTAGLKLQVFPSSNFAVAAGALYGPEQDTITSVTRTLLTGDLTWQPMPRLILQAEAHHGSEQGTQWTGVVGQAFWRFGQSTGLTVRGDVFDDPDGARTGTAQTLQSLTISPWYFYREAQEGVFSNIEFTTFRLPAFSIRPALRIDHSDQPVFEKKDGSLARSNLTALVELVYVF